MSNNELNDLVKLTKKNYYKNWRLNNKDKIKQYNSKYWQKRAEKSKNTNQ